MGLRLGGRSLWAGCAGAACGEFVLVLFVAQGKTQRVGEESIFDF